MGINVCKKRWWIAELALLVLLTLILIGGGLIIYPFDGDREGDNIAEEEKIPRMEYGIIVDSMEVVRDVVKRNEFLADILLKYDVDYNLIDKIARSPRELFDVRKIRVGYAYSVIKTMDSISIVHYFIYEQSSTEYVILDLRDTLAIYKGTKIVERRLATPAAA